MKGYLVDLGISPKDISIFTVNTIERDATYIANHTKNYIHDKHKLDFDTKIILSVARLEAEKNIDTLLKLFAGLNQSYVLCIVGRGSLETELKHLAETLGISDRVYFEGSVPRDLIWNYYADADVFVLLSKTEALGIVFWEAIHMDVPVIGSRVGGIIETMGENEDRGFLWKKEDGVKDWISKVESCVRSSPEVESMKRRAKDYVFDRLSNMTNINQIIKPNRDGQFKT